MCASEKWLVSEPTVSPCHRRFVTHIDDGAIAAICTFYGAVFSQAPQGEYSVLDMCSSWISHYPKDLNASVRMCICVCACVCAYPRVCIGVEFGILRYWSCKETLQHQGWCTCQN